MSMHFWKSSTHIPFAHPSPMSESKRCPVKSDHDLFTYENFLSVPDIQMSTGAVFATRRNLSSLSCRPASAFLTSAIVATKAWVAHFRFRAFEKISAKTLSCLTKSSVHSTRRFLLTKDMHPIVPPPICKGTLAID